MSELALQTEQYSTPETEHYSHSLRALRALGRVSIDIIPLTSNVPEVKEAWIDFVSALEENIATDPELSEKLTFNPLRFHEVVEGHVVDRHERRTIDLVADGLAASKQQALFDKNMEIQVERDEGDVLVAEAVDKLDIGEMLATISMDPKEALSDNKKYWEGKGYREGMAVLQVYYRTKTGILAGAYAIKDSDVDDLRLHSEEEGLFIPESENCNRWTRHHLITKLDETKARSFGDEFVKSYRQKRGLNQNQLSTTEFLKQNQSEVQRYFDVHIIPVATSTITGLNNEATQSLAADLHQYNADNISHEERSRLLKVANSSKFDDNDARFMESKIRYALVEHLRPKLKELLSTGGSILKDQRHTFALENKIRIVEQVNHLQLLQMNMNLSFALGRGVQENRAYGGCSSSKTESADRNLELGTQGAFGGKSDSDTEKSPSDKDEFGPLEFKCTKGHTNKREKGGWVYECQKCGEDVSCGKKKP